MLTAPGGTGSTAGGAAPGRFRRRTIGRLSRNRPAALFTAKRTHRAVRGPFCLLAPLASRGPGLVLYVIAIFMTAVSVVFSNVIIGSFRQAYAPPGMLGRVSATMRFLTMGTSPLGALLGGALAAAISPRGALWVLFAVNSAAGLFLLSRPIVRRRDLPAAAPAADPVPPGPVSR